MEKEHKLLDRGVLSYFLLLILILTVSVLASRLLEKPVALFLESTGHKVHETGFGEAVGALLCLFVFRFKFRKEGYDGQLKFKGFLYGLWMVLPVIIACCFLNFMQVIIHGSSDVLVALLSAIAPGFGEEIALRGPGLSNIMRKANDEKKLLLAFWIPAVSFGLIHATNILVGASVSATIVQMVYAIGIGLVYGAVVLRTGSLLPAILAHTLTDFSALLVKSLSESNGVMSYEVTGAEFIAPMAIGVCFGLFGIFLLRKSKRPEVLALWAHKWNKDI